jgi:hypothetical protein
MKAVGEQNDASIRRRLFKDDWLTYHIWINVLLLLNMTSIELKKRVKTVLFKQLENTFIQAFIEEYIFQYNEH